MENIKIKAKDNLELDTFYEKAEKPKAVVVIVHGMVEHKERYEYFMSKLKEAGYTSIIADLRGHGKSINETYKPSIRWITFWCHIFTGITSLNFR